MRPPLGWRPTAAMISAFELRVVDSSNLYKRIGQRNDGLGWGGPYGWNGWGGHRIRLHGSHGTGVWHHRPAAHAFAGVAPASPVLAGGVAPARPGVVGSGVPVFHGFAGGAPSLPRFGGGASVFHGFGGVAPASTGFAGSGATAFRGFVGGAPGLQDLAAAPQLSMGLGSGGGFHGGGAFSFGGHGGGGHR